MRKTVIIICIFCVFLLGLTGCSDKKNGSEVSADKYVYDCDIELKNIDSGYVNYDCILTREWVMEYASYINDSATGYDYDLFITYANGERKTITRACESGEAVLGIGYVNECDDFLLVEGNSKSNEKSADWSVVTYDKFGEKKSEVNVTEALKDYPVTTLCKVAANQDKEIYLGIFDYTTKTTEYKVLSNDGNEKYSLNLGTCSFEKFLNAKDGQVAFETKEQNGGSFIHRVFVYDAALNKEKELYSFEENLSDDEKISAVTCFDNEQLMFTTGKGIFLSDYSLGNVVQINSFDTQAFATNPSILNIVPDEKGGFLAVMERMANGAKKYLQHYISAPDEVLTIELALDMSAGADIYSEAIVEFNKLHPDSKIVVNSSYDPAVLNTKLLAGDGPVIVDSSLVTASVKSEIWESLNTVLDDSELSGEISDLVRKMMSVNGDCYAISADYYFVSLVSATVDDDLSYSKLLEHISDNEKIKYLMDNELVSGVPEWLAVNLFGGNPSDSFYIDPATRAMRFDTEEFDRMLFFLEKYSPKNESVEYFSGLEEGEVVFNLIGINTPKDLFFLDEMSKNGINIVGLPKWDGAYNELCTSHALMLRSSASEEEKEIAFEFFKMLLSKEVQMKMIQSPNFHFSVRDDVINEQIRAIKDGDYISLSFFGTGNEFFITNPPYEKISALWEKILSDSVSNIITEEGYEEILAEEFEDYFDGRITKELLISHLTNRVDLYLAEHDD